MSRIELGEEASAGEGGVAIGRKAFSEDGGFALGEEALSREDGIAIGPRAYARQGELTFAVGLTEFLRITRRGDIYVQGRRIGQDKEVIDALRLMIDLDFRLRLEPNEEDQKTVFSALEVLVTSLRSR